MDAPRPVFRPAGLPQPGEDFDYDLLMQVNRNLFGHNKHYDGPDPWRLRADSCRYHADQQRYKRCWGLMVHKWDPVTIVVSEDRTHLEFVAVVRQCDCTIGSIDLAHPRSLVRSVLRARVKEALNECLIRRIRIYP